MDAAPATARLLILVRQAAAGVDASVGGGTSCRRRFEERSIVLLILPPLQRQALGLALIDGLTHEQVAAELGVPLGTAKTRIRAGLMKASQARPGVGYGMLVDLGPAHRARSGTPSAFLEETNRRAAGTPARPR
jgi:hypothetical protein